MWDSLARDLIEQYSLIEDLDSMGRKIIIADVARLFDSCQQRFKADMPASMRLLRDYVSTHELDL